MLLMWFISCASGILSTFQWYIIYKTSFYIALKFVWFPIVNHSLTSN